MKVIAKIAAVAITITAVSAAGSLRASQDVSLYYVLVSDRYNNTIDGI